MDKRFIIAAAACGVIILVVVAFSLAQQETTAKYTSEKSENKSTTVWGICNVAIKKYLEILVFDSTTSHPSEQETTAGETFKYVPNKIILNAINSGVKSNGKEYESVTSQPDEQETTVGEILKEYYQIPKKTTPQPEDHVPGETLNVIGAKCIEEIGISPLNLTNLDYVWNLRDDKLTKDYLFCLFKATGILDKSGNIFLDAKRLNLWSEDIKEDGVMRIMNTCRGVVFGETPEDIAFLLYVCMLKDFDLRRELLILINKTKAG